ncbi:type III PLP-dependent enzyme [Phreatobacter aquaticus]|uniref:Type III PLP-dependent enzyme n=1 Tax=Phreatobacter aquaticus TaxID=2570229 RepID=A0A4D7QMX6_9HYPH|nr:type III PLP-dependent enzyme [Phreatobacter aquaticus]QCK87861.1 type III PLP-dependent enzyme [Phreatobacter aquaticus]
MSSGQPIPLAEQLIASQFSVRGADLMIGGVAARDLADQFGTPLYVYDAGLIRRTCRDLAAALDGFAEIHFSIKANPNPAVIAVLLEEGAGLEIASLGEFRAALAAGADPARILFAGPGKRADEIDAVVAAGIGEIHLETEEEIGRVAAAGARHGRRVAVSIRVNPVAEAQGGAMRMGGKPAPFGFDEEAIGPVVDRIMALPDLDLQGVHMFAGTQILDAGVLATQWRHGLEVAASVARHAGRPLRAIDLGGGLGIPYFTGEMALDLAHLKSEVAALTAFKQAEPLIRDARTLIEPGRYLVGPAGVYLMAVNAAKMSRGQRFLIMDGGMHHHLAASGNLGQIVKRDYPIVAANRMGEGAFEPAVVVGPLCTPLDTLARKAMLPAMVADDLIAVLQSGAYGLSASPAGFLSHPAPAEVLVDQAGARRIA